MEIIRKVGSRTFEDVVVRFLAEHAGKIYLGLTVLAAFVVGIRNASPG